MREISADEIVFSRGW